MNQSPSKQFTNWLALYLVICFFVFLGLFLIGDLFLNPNWLMPAISILPPVSILWTTMLWGGIGGTSGALYELWLYVAQRNNDKSKKVYWYCVSPMTGMVCGILVLILINLALPIIFDKRPPEVSDLAWWAHIVIPFTAGFRQETVWGAIKSLVSHLLPR